MGFINTGSGYPSDVITAAIVAFLVVLAAFTAVTVTIACRYHATKHASMAEARRRQRCAPAAGPVPAMSPPREGKTAWPLPESTR